MFDSLDKFFQIKNLGFGEDLYSKLSGVNFTLERGEDAVFFGVENSGVNLLFPVIVGLHKNHQGEIFYKGENIDLQDYYVKNVVRKELIYLHKDYGLINNMTVKQNISVPLEYHTRYSASEISAIVDRITEDLDLVCCRDLRPVMIRPSEALRTAYARAIALDPCLLLVEHPLEGQCLLDQVSFMKSLKKRCDSKDKSLMIISYKPKYFLDFVNRFVMFHGGDIVFDGNQDEFLSQNNPYVRQYLENSLDGPMNLLER